MALKALMLRKRIDAKKSDLEALREKAEGFTTREAELETAIGEADASNAEEMATVEGEIDSLTEEREANDAAIADLEGEIAEMESELEEEESKQRNRNDPAQQQRSEEPGTHDHKERRVNTMPMAKRIKDMNIMERDAFFNNEEVKDFLSKVRAMRGNTRAAGSIENAQVLIPEIALPMLFQIVEESSKMMKHFYTPNVPGTGRMRIDGGFPEAVWTEMYARLNELEFGYYDTEIDGYKLGGIARIPNETIEDSDINLMSEILEKLGRGIGYAYDKAGLYGKGTKMPLGIVTRLAQTAAPATVSETDRPWADLHASNIITISQDKTGIELFKELVTAFGKTKNKFSNGGKFWAMNDTTFNTLLVNAMSINAAGNIFAGIDPNSRTMPVVGGVIETRDFIPDNVIIAGYDGLYIMGQRRGVQFGQSEHYFFREDQTAFKGTARYDGKPVIAEGFVAIGINGVTPTAEMSFAQDKANDVVGILLTQTASVKVNKTVTLEAQTLPIDADITWASSDETKATVSADGVVTGVAAGTATITAASGTCNAVCTVTVTA